MVQPHEGLLDHFRSLMKAAKGKVRQKILLYPKSTALCFLFRPSIVFSTKKIPRKEWDKFLMECDTYEWASIVKACCEEFRCAM